jgi:hypothetical protein
MFNPNTKHSRNKVAFLTFTKSSKSSLFYNHSGGSPAFTAVPAEPERDPIKVFFQGDSGIDVEMNSVTSFTGFSSGLF